MSQDISMFRTPSWTLLRVVIGIAALFVSPAPAVQIFSMIHAGIDLFSFSISAVVATACIFGWWFALRGHHALSRTRMRYALAGGVFGFIIGFAAGYFGPIIFITSNVGPLMAVFVVGPLGFPAGALLGGTYALFRTHGAPT